MIAGVGAANLLVAIAVGLALRIAFVRAFPGMTPDARLYDELARNLLDHGVYGLVLDGRLTPLNFRAPGYPAFVAAIYALISPSVSAVRFAQAFVDVMSSVLTALLAARLAPASSAPRVAAIALWISIVCPFTIQYTAVPLTEVLSILLTTAALLLFLRGFAQAERLAPWLLAGLVSGAGTLVRSDAPLLLVAIALVLAVRWRSRADRPKLGRAVLGIAVGLAVTLLPWVVRNRLTIGHYELFAQGLGKGVLPGHFVPDGFYGWTMTWLTDDRDIPKAVWPVMGRFEPIAIDALPASAFDSKEERDRVGLLIERVNRDRQLSPPVDAEFAEVARERTWRHPLRTLVWLPCSRAATMWFAQKLGVGRFPELKAAIWLLNFACVGLALFTAWRFRRRPESALLLAFVVVRTAAFAALTWPEPRFVLQCYPVVIALAALALAGIERR